jgi:hypothetical protein
MRSAHGYSVKNKTPHECVVEQGRPDNKQRVLDRAAAFSSSHVICAHDRPVCSNLSFLRVCWPHARHHRENASDGPTTSLFSWSIKSRSRCLSRNKASKSSLSFSLSSPSLLHPVSGARAGFRSLSLAQGADGFRGIFVSFAVQRATALNGPGPGLVLRGKHGHQLKGCKHFQGWNSSYKSTNDALMEGQFL